MTKNLSGENIFHQLLKRAKEQRPQAETWGLCISGGLDSVVLLRLLQEVSRSTGNACLVFHVHHGFQGTEEQIQFRNQAFRNIQALCEEGNLSFFSNVESAEGNLLKLKTQFPSFPSEASEQSFRDYRWACLKRFEKQAGVSQLCFVTAHHGDDVLETRLIHLIRGVGIKGFQSFGSAEDPIWRPLTSFSRKELFELAERQKWDWWEDPSNSSLEPLRNWLRKEWLPLLEHKRPGSIRTLHRSLELLAGGLEESAWQMDGLVSPRGIALRSFRALSRERQSQVLAHYLRDLKLNAYTKGHIEEIMKRIKTAYGESSFRLCQRTWRLSEDYLWASRD